MKLTIEDVSKHQPETLFSWLPENLKGHPSLNYKVKDGGTYSVSHFYIRAGRHVVAELRSDGPLQMQKILIEDIWYYSDLVFLISCYENCTGAEVELVIPHTYAKYLPKDEQD